MLKSIFFKNSFSHILKLNNNMSIKIFFKIFKISKFSQNLDLRKFCQVSENSSFGPNFITKLIKQFHIS